MKETGGCYFEPTIFKNVKNNMKIAQEEIFGPVLTTLTFSNFEEAGPPLGITSKFKFTEKKISFSNSSMYIFTDGITEIKDPNGEMLGSDGFENYIKKYQSIPNNKRLKTIIEDIVKSGKIQKDDLTIVVIDGK